MTTDYLRREASAGRRGDFEKYLAAVPDVAPAENDRFDARTPHAEPCQSVIETAVPARPIMRLTVDAFQQWQRWMKEIESDVTHCLVNPRQIFRHLRDVVVANESHIDQHDGFIFVGFVSRAYVAQIAMGIRRHVKKDDSFSLMRLLDQIHRCASQFTYGFFLQQFPVDGSCVDWQSTAFEQFSEDGKEISTAIIQKDMEQLKSLGGQIEDLADKTIAHLDKRGFDGSVTHDDLENCIDAVDQLVCKYHTLMTGGGKSTLEPTILHDWEKIFAVPLDIRQRG